MMTHAYTRNVKYYETDKMGIVHHSNYIRWFEEARIQFMTDADLPYRDMEEAGVMIPVLGVSCKYRLPSRFDDNVVIKTHIKKYNGIVMELEYEIYGEGEDSLRITGETSHCFVDMEFKPIHLKKYNKEMHEKFMKIL